MEAAETQLTSGKYGASMCINGLSQPGLGEYTFITKQLYYGAWGVYNYAHLGRKSLMKDVTKLHYEKGRSQIL